MTVSTSSLQTLSLVSWGTWRVLAISSERLSISSSLRCLNTSAARSGPRLTISTAAFSRPGSLIRGDGSSAGAAGTGSMSSIALVLLHPGADLLGHALGVLLGDALGAHPGRARRGHLARQRGRARRAPAREVGQRGRRLDLAQPRRLAERLALAALEVAHDEEQEGEQPQAGGAVLGIVEHPAAEGPGDRGGRRRLGEGDLADVQHVAALGVDAGRGRHGVLELGDLRRRHRLVDDEADAQAVDLAGRDLRALDRLVDAEVGLGGLALVVGVAAARAGGRVRRQVARRAGRAARGGAAAAQLLALVRLLEGHALLRVRELVERRLVDVQIARDLHV